MSLIQVESHRGTVAPLNARGPLRVGSAGLGDTSRELDARLRKLRPSSPTWSEGGRDNKKSLEERLYDALASFKMYTATVAMHLEGEWRSRLFSQLDNLLSLEDWEAEDLPPQLASFSTFLRMILALKPDRRPGLGATAEGFLIAAWTVGSNRLTLECRPQDVIQWVLSRDLDGEREKAAGMTTLARLSEVLSPYRPQLWFVRGDEIPSS